MDHNKYKELLQLNILGELSKEDELDLENHLFECTECSKEYSGLKQLYSALITERPSAPDEKELISVRNNVIRTIRKESEKSSLFEKINAAVSGLFFKQYSFALGSLTFILIGLVAGYLLFGIPQTHTTVTSENIIDLDKIEKGDVDISKISFPNPFSDDGVFEFRISDLKPISYKGDLNDITVQKLLANALLNVENPGFKIRTINSIAEKAKSNFIPDPKIKDALIKSLKTDNNPGVRKGALNALINFPYDEKIRDAVLFTLENDENSANRIDAINALLEMNSDGKSIDNETKTFLRKNIEKEDNELIKYRTSKLLLGGS
jgi:hypothetical protein